MASAGPRLASLSLKGFVEMRVSDSLYQNELWPQLEHAIDLILNADDEQSRLISFEENYSTVYKIVCKGYGSVLYEDLIYKKIDVFIDSMDNALQTLKNENLKEYIERFDEALQHFDKVIQSVLSIFVYLSRCLLDGDLRKVVYNRLTERLVAKHVDTVLDILKRAQHHPFAVEPSTFSNIIRTLYQLDEDYAKLNPDIFRKFIPGYKISTGVEQLDRLSEEAKEMSRNLQNTLSDRQHREYNGCYLMAEEVVKQFTLWIDHTYNSEMKV